MVLYRAQLAVHLEIHTSPQCRLHRGPQGRATQPALWLCDELQEPIRKKKVKGGKYLAENCQQQSWPQRWLHRESERTQYTTAPQRLELGTCLLAHLMVNL